MTWLRLRPNTIPADLRALPAVIWRAEPRDDKPAKVPYRVADPMRRASSTDGATWATFDDAVEAYLSLADLPPDPTRGPVAGVGVVLVREARITCLDLDKVIDDQDQLDVRAATIVERCDSWTERSPGARGLHVFVRGTVPRGIRGNQFEAYSEARFIAVTGHQWPGTPNTLCLQQSYLDYLARRAEGRPTGRPASRVPPPDDLAGALLAKLGALGVRPARLKRWGDGYLVELIACPWADEHSTGRGGAAVMIHASGAWDFTCLHAHCAGRGWRDFRDLMERRV